MAQKNPKSNIVTTKCQDSSEMSQNNIIIWLDSNVDFCTQGNQEILSQLQSIVRTLKTFSDIDQCIEYLQQITDEKVFLIVSDSFIKQIASLEEQFNQLYSIYVVCNQKTKYEDIIKTFKKGRGVFTQIKTVYYKLKKEIRQMNDDPLPFSIVSSSSTRNLNELKPAFMYLQLLKENLLEIEYNSDIDIQQFVNYCRPYYKNDKEETKIIDDFQKEYSKHTPIWWYTLDSFIYQILNKALRNVDVDIIFKMGFFIQDLHEQIKQCHSNWKFTEKYMTVYRGMDMSKMDFNELQKGGFCIFDSFLSTSLEESVARRFIRVNRNDPNKTSILFEIKIDTSISSVPFTPIQHLSAIPNEEEILFSMATVFRIDEIKQIEQNFYKINLSSTNDRDPVLKRLTDHMRISLGHEKGWRGLAQLMIKLSQFDRAMDIYQVLLKTVPVDDKKENAFLHNQLGYILKQKDQLNEAFSHYQEALKIYRTYLSDTDPQLSSLYSNIGGILKKLGDPNGALKYYELVLKIDLAATKPNQLEIAIDHNNIGSVYDDLGKYSQALKCYEEALDIKLSHLPPNHPSLASTYSNIGLIHKKMGDCSTALSYYEKTLQIQQKSLPPDHPSLIVTYGKLATALEGLHQYEKAIKYAELAVNIAKKAYGSSHSETAKRQQHLKELQQKI